MIKGLFADKSLFQQLLLLFFLAFMGTLFFTAIGLAIAAGIYDISTEEAFSIISNLNSSAGRESFKIIQGFSTIGTFLVPAILGAHLLSHQPERFMGLDRFPQPAYLFIILLILAGYGLGAASDVLYRISESFPWPDDLIASFESSQQIMTEQYQALLQMANPVEFMQVFLLMAILPAVGEEALFRGTLQPLLQRYMSPHLAIWLTAFMFALLHLQYLSFLSIFVLGAVLGYLRYWTNSIWLPTLLHLVNNGAIVIAVYFLDMDYAENLSGTESLSWIESTVLIAISAVCLLIMERISRKARLD